MLKLALDNQVLAEVALLRWLAKELDASGWAASVNARLGEVKK